LRSKSFLDPSHTDASEPDAEIAGGKRILEERLGAAVKLCAYGFEAAFSRWE
jgi:hypothetical protein